MVKIIPIVVNSNSIIFDVHNSKKETIGEFSQRIRKEKNLSTQDVADNSDGMISQSYVSKIENDPFRDITIRRLRGLARGLGETEQKAFDVIRGKDSDSKIIENERFQNLLENFERLDIKDKNDLEIIFKIFEREVSERQPKKRNPLEGLKFTSEKQKEKELKNAAPQKERDVKK